MNQENTNKLYAAFPNQYRGRFKSQQESSMRIGFQRDNGWFDIIWDFSQELENVALQLGIERTSADWPEVSQIKQKVGTLRIYLVGGKAAFGNEIQSGYVRSEITCEICGAIRSAASNTGNSAKILCQTHKADYINQRLL